jgi:hypothetical protein
MKPIRLIPPLDPTRRLIQPIGLGWITVAPSQIRLVLIRRSVLIHPGPIPTRPIFNSLAKVLSLLQLQQFAQRSPGHSIRRGKTWKRIASHEPMPFPWKMRKGRGCPIRVLVILFQTSSFKILSKIPVSTLFSELF